MTVHDDQKAAKAPLVGSTGADWTVGVYSCTDDMGLCCDVLWCYPCVQGRISNAVDGLANNMSCGVCCLCCCMGAPPCRFFFNCGKRGMIAKKYGIKESCCSDCMLSLFCDPCVVCQHHTELSAQGVPPGNVCCASSRQFPNAGPPRMHMGAQPYHPGTQYGTHQGMPPGAGTPYAQSQADPAGTQYGGQAQAMPAGAGTPYAQSQAVPAGTHYGGQDQAMPAGAGTQANPGGAATQYEVMPAGTQYPGAS